MSDLLRGRVVTPAGLLDDGFVAVDGDRITDVGPASTYRGRLPAAVGTILPGLVDVHCHGGGGASFTLGDPAQVTTAAAHHLGQGTTSLIASAVTDTPKAMTAAVATAAAAVEADEVAAIHLEGPFLSAARCGAQDPRHLRAPDLGLAKELIEAGSGHVRVMTVAPELPGAEVLIELLADHGVVGAVGHTQADADTIERALTAAGTGLVTHLFNGMPPLHHRDPGPVAGALATAARGQARVELIADGVHLADATVRMVFTLLGPHRVVLVTDAMAAAGMPAGDYRLGPQRVRVSDGVARLRGKGPTSIAGGTARLLDVVRRCVQSAGVGLHDAVTAASATPAAALSLDRELGAVEPGLRADLLVVDSELHPQRVMRRGAWLT